MVFADKLNKKIIDLINQPVDVQKLCDAIKSSFAAEGYDFLEMKQKQKKNQYGRQLGWEFYAEIEYDELAKIEVKIIVDVLNLKAIKRGSKSYEKGDINVKMFPTLILDYKNRWNSSKFMEYLFKIYKNFLAKQKFDDLYYEREDEEIKRIYDKIKKSLELLK